MICLPIILRLPSSRGIRLDKDAGREIEDITRLVFEIGYYTTEDLDTLKKADLGRAGGIHTQSADLVILTDSPRGKIINAERSLRVTIDDVCVPFKQWLYGGSVAGPRSPSLAITRSLRSLQVMSFKKGSPFDGDDYRYAERLFFIEPAFLNAAARQIANLYLRFAEGKLNPAEFKRRLNGIMNRSDRDDLLQQLERNQAVAYAPKIELTPVQALEDLFYRFCLDPEEYRYAQRLSAIDEDLLTEKARRIADTYKRVARGELNPAGLVQRLNRILSKEDRMKLIEELEKRQGEAQGISRSQAPL